MLHTQFMNKDCSLWSPRAQQTPTLRAVPVAGGRGVVGLTYGTMFSALGTYGLSQTQHSHNIQQADTVGDDIIADGES